MKRTNTAGVLLACLAVTAHVAPRPTAAAPAPTTVPVAVQPAPRAAPADVNGKTFDLVVVGATPGGIACAVRAAREGLSVLLVNHGWHVGGFMTSGAGGWEAPYDGLRSPLYAEMRNGAAEYYKRTYGDGSPQHLASQPNAGSNRHIDRAKIEPRVAEMLFERMIGDAAPRLVVLTGYDVASVERDAALLRAVTLREAGGERTVRVAGGAFADGTYEGDLLAAAKVPYRVGREGRREYAEPHAGVIYTRDRERPAGQAGFPTDAAEGRLKIRTQPHDADEIVAPDDGGRADGSVMAYNYRLILTKDPANRVPVPKPPDADAATWRRPLSRSIVPDLPNGKIAWNGGGRLVGPQNDYPEADWPLRDRIARQYLDAALRDLWLVQNAPGVPDDERAFWKDYGLAKDEFADNGNLPYEIYVREARRLVGRYVFTEQDGLIAAETGRTPIHASSVAVTDWPMDSVACLSRKVGKSNADGVFFLSEQSRPAQVPYGSLLPIGADNLLVPVCLSATHVGWGCLRLEPVWMQTGEAAGFAAALAKQHATTPAGLDPDLLVRALVAHHTMVSFFNDVDVAATDEPWGPAAQYFGTKGFFPDYDARPGEPLKRATALVWAHGVGTLLQRRLDPNAVARAVAAAERTEATMTAGEFAALLPARSGEAGLAKPDAPVTRGSALQALFALLP